MTQRRPPVIATWLLRHLGCSANNEAVLGDLAEEYSRKGASWYWRQALKAIPVSTFREVRGHKRMAVRAVVVALFAWLVFTAMDPTVEYFLPPGPHPSLDLAQARHHPIGVSAALLYHPVFRGSILNHSNPVLFVLWIQILLPLIVWAMIGWIVARVNIRQYRRDLVIVFACWMLLMHLLLIGPAIRELARFGASHLVVPLVAYAVTSVAAILVGGSLRRKKLEAGALGVSE